MPKTTIVKKNLKNSTYLTLKEKLINCIYPPGTILNEIQLAEDFGLSRTPVREAISRLEMDGYVKVMPKKGIYVTDISLNDVHQIFQTRIEIEPIALKLAAPYLETDELIMFRNRFEHDSPDIINAFRLDTAMHLFIIEHCGNRYIIDMMRKLFDDNTRIVIASKQNQVRIHNAKCEHLEILDSLIAREDLEKTAALMGAHLETCRRAALDYFYSLEYSHSVPEKAQYMQELSKLSQQS
ncbi:MAG: GntR family transcriptional regulator [Enterocloster aldenensis]|nr:GntR family transcriptional regulator [Enterocloster citroniae]